MRELGDQFFTEFSWHAPLPFFQTSWPIHGAISFPADHASWLRAECGSCHAHDAAPQSLTALLASQAFSAFSYVRQRTDIGGADAYR